MYQEPKNEISEIIPSSPCQSKIYLITQNGKKSIKKVANYNISQEFNILNSCDNKHIIKVYNRESLKIYTMEYCELGDINTGLPYQSIESLKSTFCEMCSAVDYLHSHEICHLDLKLSNFVRNSEGIVKLLDFGHASYSIEPIRSVRGTTEYNSSERYQPGYDGKKADIFSLGICLTALMIGSVPCTRNKQAFPNTVTFQTRPDFFWDNLERLNEKSNPDFPGLDSEAVDLIEMMVNQDPSSRPDITSVLSHCFFK